MSSRKPSPRQKRWHESERFREIGRQAITQWNAGPRKQRPTCGATAKKTGEPCRNAAMGNGRCRLHGGRTPGGDDWHKPRFSSAVASPQRYEQKLARKISDLERDRRKSARRVAVMTPEARERHDLWQKTHKPTSMRARAVARAEAKQNAEIRARMARAEVKHGGEALLRPAPSALSLASGDDCRLTMEISMPTKKQTPKDVAAALRQQMQTEGASIAYEALKDVARDRTAPAQARATAGTSILRAAGFFEKQQDDADDKPPDQMSIGELIAYNSRQMDEILELDRQILNADEQDPESDETERETNPMD